MLYRTDVSVLLQFCAAVHIHIPYCVVFNIKNVNLYEHTGTVRARWTPMAIRWRRRPGRYHVVIDQRSIVSHSLVWKYSTAWKHYRNVIKPSRSSRNPGLEKSNDKRDRYGSGVALRRSTRYATLHFCDTLKIVWKTSCERREIE